MITGELTTIARPYASAAFEYALAKHALPEWEGMLLSAATLVEQDEINLLLSSSEMSSSQLAELFSDVLAKVLDPEKTNFIRLLAENKRLAVLPAIAALFTSYREDYEKIMDVQVVSAIKLNDSYQEKLVNKLTLRLQRRVSLQCEVDPSLLGGAIVRAGDMVIDGSVRSKLNRLLESL
jgi:F-type H+-transporting ATPase subunit delta